MSTLRGYQEHHNGQHLCGGGHRGDGDGGEGDQLGDGEEAHAKAD